MDRIGRYKIVRELGRGAMGVVYHAIDPNIGRPVAIKTIQFLANRKPEELDRMRERLFREARSAGILSHPGIVTIYDVDQQGDLAYIAMEYVDGPTLDQMLGESAGLPPGKLFSILGQTAAALDYAHSKGIVHRDIKPANIMLTADGTAKITDFGIAKIAASESLTTTGSIVGTPHYMSPEQVQGQPIDGRSDQFSLAVIAYEMLTGEKPYTGEHLTTVVYKIVAEEPVPPRRLNHTLSPAIEGALLKALAKRPDARYRSCQEFTESLEKACATTKTWKPMPRAGMLDEPTLGETPRATAPAKSATLPPPRRPRRAESTSTLSGERRKGGFMPFLFGTLVVAGLLALIGWQAAPWLAPARTIAHHEKPPPDPAPKEVPPPVTPPAAPVSQPATPPSGVDAKPSPLGPPPGQAKAPVRAGPPQDVQIVSSPSGATARLDGDPNVSCVTPCTLQAAPGKHTLVLFKSGHQMDSREIVVRDEPVELAPFALRPSEGKLMLSSDPEGATITVNGRRMPMVTNAGLGLAPGKYEVTVEKNGRQATVTVEIKDGLTTYRKFLLNP